MTRRLALIVTALFIAAPAITFGSKPAAASGCPASGYYWYTLSSSVSIGNGFYAYAETGLQLFCGSNLHAGNFRAAEEVWDTSAVIPQWFASSLQAEAVIRGIGHTGSGAPTSTWHNTTNGYYYGEIFSPYENDNQTCADTVGPWASNPSSSYYDSHGVNHALPYSYIELNVVPCQWDGTYDPGVKVEGH